MSVDPSQLDPQAQLAAANAELASIKKQNEELQQNASKAQLGEARARALKDFGGNIDDDVLNFYHGDATGLYDYAKALNDKMAAKQATAPPSGTTAGATTPVAVPQTPAPAPGPGTNVSPESARKLELEQYRIKALDKDIDMGGKLGPAGIATQIRGGGEARRYYEMAIGEGLAEHFARMKR